MTATRTPGLPEGEVPFTLDGEAVLARPGESILQAAQRYGMEIPHLCYHPDYGSDGNCRACMVEIEGEPRLAAACCRQPEPGMVVVAAHGRARDAQRMVLALLRSEMPDHPVSGRGPESEFETWCRRLGVELPGFAPSAPIPEDRSHPAIAVNLDACIRCTRCLRACREVQVNDVIGFAYRGERSKIVFDQDDALGTSGCVACGECVQACPTQALMPAGIAAFTPGRRVETVCPYCGVGCLLTYHVANGRIVCAEGRDGPANRGRLCVKGRFGFDYVHSPERLTQPLIRREGAPKTPEIVSREAMMDLFREATWDEALDAAAAGLRRIRDGIGPGALAGFGSAKGSNEEAYLFQKLVRTGFRTNNVDHCTRLCHASSVAALLECIGSGAVSNQVADVARADVILVIGAKPTVNHPVAASFIKNAAAEGKTLIILDPYASDLCRHATHFLQFRADTDVLLLNAMMHCIIEEGLHNLGFIERHTTGYDALRRTVLGYSPERVAPICGVSPQALREVARLYATSRGSMIFWGMGVSQHVHGTDNARCLISLALLTGQIGRDGAGLHPLRGQNNVQGASDVGLIPMMLPGYRPVGDGEARSAFERRWKHPLDGTPGLTVVEVMQAIHRGEVRGMYIEGENPAMSDPNLRHAREALALLDHLVVQEIFFTETAGFADVVLPASAFPEKSGSFTNTDRRVQMGRQAVEPPGDARQDFWIIQEIARRLGLDWDYGGPEEVFAEICQVIPSMGGMNWQRLAETHSLTYPLPHDGDPGEPTIFTDGFPTPDGRARFVPAEYSHADELPDELYPLVFTTGRQLEHWHTGSMTRNVPVLDELEPEPVVSIHPEDMTDYGIVEGGTVCVESRRGELRASARSDPGLQRGTLFMAFCYHEAAANLLTNEALDPIAKIPEFKYCAVRLSRAFRDDDTGESKPKGKATAN